MKRFIIIVAIFINSIGIQSQISRAEYFVDTDPGIGNGSSITVSGNNINQDISIPTVGLTEGVHKLYIRVLNASGSWSLYDKKVFYINQNQSNSFNIASAEYFIDTDPGVGNGTEISANGQIINQDFTVSTAGLSAGVHKLYVRFINQDGTWSLYDKNVFFVNQNNNNNSSIASAEYFIDSDPGVGNGIAIAVSGNSINQDLNIPTTGISNGVHKLYVRVINNDGSWSLYDKNIFYINPDNSNTANIASAEYFIDTDPGLGNGTTLSVTGNVIDQDFNIPTTGFSEGVHKLYVRLINDDGTWSFYDNNVFYLSQHLNNTALITGMEYFIDIDPGVGNATSINITEGEDIDSNLVLQIPNNLPNGDHFLYVRMQNADGTWSLHARSESLPALSNTDFTLHNFKFYPNPVEQVLFLNTNGQSITNLKIINMIGQVVYNGVPEENQIDLTSFNSGTYLLHLKTNIGSVSKKFVKK